MPLPLSRPAAPDAARASIVGRAPRRGAYWPSPHQETLLRAALSDGAAARRAWELVRPGLDPERADHASQQILPLLGANLARLGVTDPLVNRLATLRERTGAENRALFAAGRQILLALHAAGVDTLMLKGGALAVSVYRDIGLRPMGDLDVLVRTGQARAAVEALAAAGWCGRAAVTPEYIRTQHAADLFAAGDLKCDLHWHVYWECCGPDADDELWAASVPLAFAGVDTRTLAVADQLLHVCVHGSRRARRPGIRWIADALAVLRAGGVDWARLLGQAAERGVVLRAGTMLLYLRDAFAAPVPDEVVGELQALPVSWLERVEYRVGNRPQGLLGELPSYWCNYRRLRRAAGGSPLGFPRYLQQTWKLGSLGQVVGAALNRAAQRVRTAVFGAPAPE